MSKKNVMIINKNKKNGKFIFLDPSVEILTQSLYYILFVFR